MNLGVPFTVIGVIMLLISFMLGRRAARPPPKIPSAKIEDGRAFQRDRPTGQRISIGKIVMRALGVGLVLAGCALMFLSTILGGSGT